MRRLPPFSALRAFEAAARLGSFAAAGGELHQTPSAISHQVRALEAWFDRPLFVRSIRRVTLTADGDRLLGELSAAFDQIEDACTALRPSAARSSLSVHCAPSFASKWLGPRLPRFIQAHPAITIGLSSSAEPVDLKSHTDVDIDITYGAPPARAGVVVESLGSEPTLPLAAPQLFNGSPPARPRDLARFTLIDSKLNPVQWADWCKLNGLKLPPSARPSFDRGSLAVAAAADGLGIALETSRFAEAELARGELLAIDGPAFRRIERETHFLCYRKTNEERATIVVFKQWLTAELGGHERAN
jgi:LysR family transcriptional regulator, glycine cleavage system transcriptional activator